MSQLTHRAGALLESLACLERLTAHVHGVLGRVLGVLQERSEAEGSWEGIGERLLLPWVKEEGQREEVMRAIVEAGEVARAGVEEARRREAV